MPAQQYRKKPVVIEATQWFENGDHPEDYVGTEVDPVSGTEYTAEYRREHSWEGSVVRYFRHPDVPSEQACKHCARIMHDHGWIDTLEGGHIVCPGDYVITGVQGERYPCKPDIFAETYSAAKPELAKKITVDQAQKKLFIDGAQLPWHIAERGPAVDKDPDSEAYIVTVPIAAEHVEVIQ